MRHDFCPELLDLEAVDLDFALHRPHHRQVPPRSESDADPLSPNLSRVHKIARINDAAARGSLGDSGHAGGRGKC